LGSSKHLGLVKLQTGVYKKEVHSVLGHKKGNWHIDSGWHSLTNTTPLCMKISEEKKKNQPNGPKLRLYLHALKLEKKDIIV